jgi:tyrosinase
MSKKDRSSYIRAVECLISKPSLSNPAEVPGARNRLDDFAAAHIQETNNIHFNGNLYAWHRYFTWAYEQTLRNECSYTGGQPYWDWTLYADDPRLSPVFDGSKYSMGSNGKVIPHGPTLLAAFGKQFTLPPGTGGGCIETGPFSNLTVRSYVFQDVRVFQPPPSIPFFVFLLAGYCHRYPLGILCSQSYKLELHSNPHQYRSTSA